MGKKAEATPVRRRRIFAICGKGGVGKTAFTALLTRALSESGTAGKLLVIDADPALGLTHALGMQVEKTIGQVREAIITAAKLGSNTDIAEIAGMLDYMVLEALVEGGNHALLAMGRSETLGCFCSVNDLLRDAIEFLSQRFDTILIDGEAGLEQINRQVMSELDCLLILTDASSRGLQTVALLKEMVEEKNIIRCGKIGVVFNRVQGDEDFLAQSAAKIGIDVLGFVPQDPRIASYDLIGRPLPGLPGDCAALAAIRGIADNLGTTPQ
jgi:CO dehydrogenase maturation factor